MRRGAVLILVLVALVIGAAAGWFVSEYHPTPQLKTDIVCHYEGGTVHDDICVKDGNVLTIDLGGSK